MLRTEPFDLIGGKLLESRSIFDWLELWWTHSPVPLAAEDRIVWRGAELGEPKSFEDMPFAIERWCTFYGMPVFAPCFKPLVYPVSILMPGPRFTTLPPSAF